MSSFERGAAFSIILATVPAPPSLLARVPNRQPLRPASAVNGYAKSPIARTSERQSRHDSDASPAVSDASKQKLRCPRFRLQTLIEPIFILMATNSKKFAK